MGGILKMGGLIALSLIAASFFFGGLSLGIWFSGAMVLLAGGSILYNTSNIIHHYRTDQYVAASLGLFASVALLFFYLLQIFMSRD
jgi:FtsH-binding integral membrane protein